MLALSLVPLSFICWVIHLKTNSFAALTHAIALCAFAIYVYPLSAWGLLLFPAITYRYSSRFAWDTALGLGGILLASVVMFLIARLTGTSFPSFFSQH